MIAPGTDLPDAAEDEDYAAAWDAKFGPDAHDTTAEEDAGL